MKRDPSQSAFAADGFPETSTGAYFPAGARRAAAAQPAPLPPSAAMSAFLAALDRLEETLDFETGMLRAHRPFDFEDVNNRKSRSLLELTRMARGLPAASRDLLAPRLKGLSSKLIANQAVLKLNLDAVREIAALLVGALGEAESDGTYASPFDRRVVA